MLVQVSAQSPSLLLQIPAALTLQVTPDQFATLSTANRDLRLERTASGELIVNSPTGGETGHRNLSITGQLSVWFEANDTLGKAFDYLELTPVFECSFLDIPPWMLLLASCCTVKCVPRYIAPHYKPGYE